MKAAYVTLCFFIFNALSHAQNAWEPASAGLTTLTVLSIAVDSSDTLYAGTQGSGIFKSVDNGQNWSRIDIGLDLKNIQEIATATNGGVYITAHSKEGLVASSGNFIYYSPDHGGSWTPRVDGLPTTVSRFLVTSVEIDNQNVAYLGFETTVDPAIGGCYRFAQQQSDWVTIHGKPYYQDPLPESIAFDNGNNVFIGDWRGYEGGEPLGWENGVYKWDPILSYFTYLPSFSSCHCTVDVSSLAFDLDGSLIAGVAGTIYRANPPGSEWVNVSNGLPSTPALVTSIVIRPQPLRDLFIALANPFNPYNDPAFIGPNGVYRFSADSWSEVNSGLTNTDVTEMVVNSQGVLFAATRGGGVFRSTPFVPVTLSEFQVE